MTHVRRSIPKPNSLPRLAALFASTAALALALPGCGGGGGGGGAAGTPPPPSPPPSVEISGVVSDGPLQGATACYDLNDNNVCDAGEPTSTATTANGSYTINVLTSVAGQHAVIVNVPAGAIDQTTNAPIGVALTLKAPATGNGGSQSVFVSPLTTLVVGQMQATGANAADAAATIQAQTGLSLSPLTDYSGPTAPLLQAALFARLVVQTQKVLAAALAPQLGQPDLSGATVTQADIEKAAGDALRGALPALAAVLADPAVSGATDLQAALIAAAQDLVATQPALNPAEALSVAIAARLADLSAATPGATAVLRGFAYTDANNWTARFMAASALDNTPDSNGLVHFYDVHKQNIAGVISTWGFGTLEARQGDVHWSGNLWKACSLFERSSGTPRDALGRSSYNYCDGWEKGVGTRTGIDIAGQSMASVITNRIRTQPGEDNGVAYANWGPADLNLLGSATFPAGSQLFTQVSNPTETAFAYDVTSPVSTFGTVAAAGSIQIDAVQACSRAFIGAVASFTVGTLEQLVTVNTGNSCHVLPQSDVNGSSLDPNLWWSASSVSIGSVPDAKVQPTGTGNFFTTTANLRVAFTGGNGVTYYSCYVRTNGGSARNCSVIGTGTYSIQTLGTVPNIGRVMTFANLPTIAQRLSFSRVFVERDGVVYFGYRNAPNVARTTLRLNLPAANALFSTLGIAAIVP